MTRRLICSAVTALALVGCGGSLATGSNENGRGEPSGLSDAGLAGAPDSAGADSGRAGVLTVHGAPLSHASTIAADESDVYWVTEPGTVLRQSKLGGAVSTVATDRCGANRIALDDAYVYFSAGWSSSDCPGTVSRVPKVGGPVTRVTSQFTFPDGGGFVLDDESVYFVGMPADASGNGPSTAAVYAAPKSGGTAVVVAAPAATGAPAVDGENVYWLAPQGLPPDPTTAVPVSIMQTPRHGGANRMLATLTRNITALVFFDDRVYWVASGRHGVEYLCIDCGAPAQVQSLGPGESSPKALVTMSSGKLISDAVVDSGGLWLTLEGTRSGQGIDYPPNDDHTGALIRVPTGGAQESVATDLPFVSDLAVDRDHVFATQDTSPLSLAK